MTSPTTKLEAVNVMLSTLGEAPVNSLSSGLIDAEMAEQILDNVNREVQAQGWNFNTETDYTIAVNTAGEIELPSSFVRVDLAKSETKYRSSRNEYVQRGNKIYDTVQHTYVINKALKLDVVVLLDFELIPEIARRYVAIRASRIFQERVLGSTNISAQNRTDEQQAQLALRDMEGDNGDYSIFDDYGTYSVLDRTSTSKVITNGTSF
jgi:hypothetical protein|tara:strand:- start:23 stop:646 length:624 start_codon:yes stop_codon:yes gene_type:complete